MSGSSPDNANAVNLTSTTTAPTQSVPSHPSDGIGDPFNHVGDGIFLQTNTAQGLAGICVWVALFLTCQQVSSNIFLTSKKKTHYLQYVANHSMSTVWQLNLVLFSVFKN